MFWRPSFAIWKGSFVLYIFPIFFFVWSFMLTFSPAFLARNFQLEDISNQKTCAAIAQAKYQRKILHSFTFRNTAPQFRCMQLRRAVHPKSIGWFYFSPLLRHLMLKDNCWRQVCYLICRHFPTYNRLRNYPSFFTQSFKTFRFSHEWLPNKR